MQRRVAIVGVGQVPARALSPEQSYKELVYEAATRAYADAGIDPRKDVQSFVSVSEDMLEGTGIFDEYVPDQLGAILRSVHTICGEGLQGLASACMQILTGAVDVVVVEGHSKNSNILTPSYVTAFAFDPLYNRPLSFHPCAIAGMEMRRYMLESGATLEQCAMVSVKNHRNALRNPCAAYGADLSLEDVLHAPQMFSPLAQLDASSPADGATVVVLAAEEVAKTLCTRPIWVWGIGWATETPNLETRDWGSAVYARLAANMAYQMAAIKHPRKEVQLAELDDTFSYKELQHLEALGLCRKGEAGPLTGEGATAREGSLPVNVSGGSLGMGHLGEASGLYRAAELVYQLRGEAGPRQVPKVEVAVGQSWRGVPTATGAVVVLSNMEPRRR